MPKLKTALSYDPETGVLRWLVSNSNQVKVGDIAGTIGSKGYRQIVVYGKSYLAHRLGWFLHHDSWPSRSLDHINEVRDDNRLVNLRLATRGQNGCNRGKNKNNRSGFKNVCWHKASKSWLAQIGHEGVQIHLGLFDTPEEAYAAYCAAAVRYHGEFANTGAIQ